MITSFFHLPMLSFQQSTRFLYFNYLIFFVSYDWCCIFIFCFITSCTETHDLSGPGLCFLRFDYFFLSSAYTLISFCKKLLLFNYIIFLLSYHWCYLFIFCFITSCKETHNFNGLGLCFLRFDYFFLSSTYTFVPFCRKIL